MPVEQLKKAATFNEVDNMRSVSSRVMTGRVISGGTGLCDLVLDVDYIINSEFIENEDDIKRSQFVKFINNPIIMDILNRKDFEIFKVKN